MVRLIKTGAPHITVTEAPQVFLVLKIDGYDRVLCEKIVSAPRNLLKIDAVHHDGGGVLSKLLPDVLFQYIHIFVQRIDCELRERAEGLAVPRERLPGEKMAVFGREDLHRGAFRCHDRNKAIYR